MGDGSNTVAVTVVVPPAPRAHQPGHPGAPQPHHLAWTGAPIDTLTALATTAVVVGTVLITAFRRRGHRRTSWGTS